MGIIIEINPFHFWRGFFYPLKICNIVAKIFYLYIMDSSFNNILGQVNAKAPFNGVLGNKFTNEGDEPVNLAAAKAWMRVDLTADDSLITSLITTSRQMCEAYLGQSLISRDIEILLNNQNGNAFIPYGPVVLNDDGTPDLTVVNKNGNTLTDYTVGGSEFPYLITPIDDRIKISYSSAPTISQQFKTAILQQVAYLYENRGDVQQGQELSPMAKTILKPYRSIL